MKIYLTAPTAGAISTPAQSMGGYISSTEVNNGALSNVFGLVSKYTQQQNKAEYRVLAIYNDSGAALTGLQAYLNYAADDSDSATIDEVEAELSIGYALPSVDSCSELYTQIIQPGGKPYSIDFVTADGEDNALALPDLANEGYLFIFLKRELDSVVLTDDELKELSEGTLTLATEENIDLVFVWD